MTISSSTSRADYTGDGTTVAFPVPFAFFDASELRVVARVIATGVETVQALTTNYTVTGGGGNTGTVTAVTAPPSSVQWSILRNTRRTQDVDYQANDPFPAETHERALDRVVAVVQEIERDQLRSLRVAETDSTASLVLPTQDERANRMLGFDASGNPVPVVPGSLGVVVTPYAEGLLSSDTAAGARATLGVPDTFAGFRNVVINGNPIINQRAYVSGTNTSGANQYTLDRWRVVVSGQALSWTDSAGVRTCTAPAGGVEQVIEGTGLIGGTYTLTWTGTASATVNGSAVTNGGQVTLTGGANATLRFTGGTFSLVQLEPGSTATPFERRPVGIEEKLCRRYFEIRQSAIGFGGFASGAVGVFPIEIETKRVTPAVSGVLSSLVNVTTGTIGAISPADIALTLTCTATGNCSAVYTCGISAEF